MDCIEHHSAVFTELRGAERGCIVYVDAKYRVPTIFCHTTNKRDRNNLFTISLNSLGVINMDIFLQCGLPEGFEGRPGVERGCGGGDREEGWSLVVEDEDERILGGVG